MSRIPEGAALAAILVALFALGARVAPDLALAQSAEGVAEPAGEPAEGDAPVFLMPKTGPFTPAEVEVPNAEAIAAWARSGHANAASEAFRHWDEDGEIPPTCATCHSGAGFRSYHGLDGSEPGLREEPFAIGGVVDCETCHSPGMAQITEIALPTGRMHPVASGEASCATCHQGRASGEAVDEATDGIREDTPSAGLRFVNPHYNIALAINLGGYGRLGYQYPGKSYSGRFSHAKPVATCVSCHDPHRLTVDERTCLTCHESGDPKEVRISRQSYDGSGDTEKGIFRDIRSNSDLLMTMIGDYAREVAGAPLVYDGSRYPYFFADENGDGRIDEAGGRPVAYGAFTPRLLKAIYNWKFVSADPGAHVHNPHYALELLYDSIADLAGALDRDIASFDLLR